MTLPAPDHVVGWIPMGPSTTEEHPCAVTAPADASAADGVATA
jgi:hypothetical protein